MSSVNNILYSIQNMSPAMLSIGGGSRGAGYDGLAALTSSLFGTSNTNGTTGTGNPLLDSLLNGSGSSSSSANDKVSVSYKKVGDQIVNDMAALTAETIKKYPELDKDYVIAIIDDGSGREARVYSRAEILANFEGSEKEKKALEQELTKNPLMVFENGNGLPESSAGQGAQALSDKLNTFLTKYNDTLNSVSKAGYDPLANMLANSSMKKNLVNYAGPQEIDEEAGNRELSQTILKGLKELIEKAVQEESALKDDYVVAIIDDGVSREAKVYSRSALLENFVGTDEEKEKLKKQLDADPLMVFLNDKGLEDSATDGAYGELASAINKYLSDNSKDIDALDKEGYDPLADLIGDSSVKKALASYISSAIA